jgi:hypothetical protein
MIRNYVFPESLGVGGGCGGGIWDLGLLSSLNLWCLMYHTFSSLSIHTSSSGAAGSAFYTGLLVSAHSSFPPGSFSTECFSFPALDTTCLHCGLFRWPAILVDDFTISAISSNQIACGPAFPYGRIEIWIKSRRNGSI